MAINDFKDRESLEFGREDIGEYLISVITGGIYESPHIIFREYIQNAYDEIYAWNESPEPGRIEIRLNKPNIHIYDNGPGMSRNEIRDSLSRIGISDKPYGEFSGFMGIGKFAGLSMSEKVRISSSKYGQTGKNWVEFDGEEMLLAIEGRRSRGETNPISDTLESHSSYNKNTLPCSKENHFTGVHLLNVSESYWNEIRKDSFVTKLGHVSPLNQDPEFEHSEAVEDILREIYPDHYFPIQLYLDGQEVFRPYSDNLSSPRAVEITDDDGSQLAHGWVCLHNESEQIPNELLRGIGLFHRGISIGSRKLPDEIGLYSGSNKHMFRWYMGELYLVDTDIQLTADRRGFRQDENAVNFVEHATNEFQKLVRRARKFSKRENAFEKAPDSIETINSIIERVEEGSISKEEVPRAVERLSIARRDIERNRVRHLDGELEERAREAMGKADELIRSLTESDARVQSTETSQENNAKEGDAEEDDSEGTSEVNDNTESEEGEDTTEENASVDFPSLPNRLGLSEAETQLYGVILEALADATGGRDTGRFADLYGIIKDRLHSEYTPVQNDSK